MAVGRHTVRLWQTAELFPPGQDLMFLLMNTFLKKLPSFHAERNVETKHKCEVLQIQNQLTPIHEMYIRLIFQLSNYLAEDSDVFIKVSYHSLKEHGGRVVVRVVVTFLCIISHKTENQRVISFATIIVTVYELCDNI